MLISRKDVTARRVNVSKVEMDVEFINLWISFCHREEHVLKPNIRVKGINIYYNLIARKSKFRYFLGTGFYT